jgi:hypothetical protein
MSLPPMPTSSNDSALCPTPTGADLGVTGSGPVAATGPRCHPQPLISRDGHIRNGFAPN